MTMSHVKINEVEGRYGVHECWLDGRNIANAVSGLKIDMTEPGSRPTVILEMRQIEARFDAQADIIVDEFTRDLLVELGWTPPLPVDVDAQHVLDSEAG